MIQRPVTPYDIVMQHLHRRDGRGEETRGDESEGSRAYGGGPYKGPGKTGEAIVRKSAMAQAPMHYLTQWDTDTLRVLRFLVAASRAAQSGQRGHIGANEQRVTDKSRREITSRCTRVVNTYGGITDSIVRKFFHRDVR